MQKQPRRRSSGRTHTRLYFASESPHRRRGRVALKVLGALLGVAAVVAIVWFLVARFGGQSEGEPASEPVPAESAVSDYDASLFMVGDALIHELVYTYAATGETDAAGLPVYDFRPMLAHVKPISERYDLAYYNQETVLGGTVLGLSTYPRFNSPFEVGDAFRDAGFNLVSLATNHTMDRGVAGVENSLAYWRQYQDEVYFDGSATSFEERDAIDIREVNGISYAFFAYTMWNNGLSTPAGQEYLNNEWNEDLARAQIEAVRDQVDVVVVAMHWGTEYAHAESAAQAEVAEFLHGLGVDIIIGAHPHVVQPVTVLSTPLADATTPDVATDSTTDSTAATPRGWVEDGEKKTLVIYSLGNFLSDQDGVERLTGLMASTKIHKHVEGDATTISVAPLRAELIYTVRNRAARTFTVYPYSELNDSLLPGYANYQAEFESIVSRYGQAEFMSLASDDYATQAD